MDSAFDRNKLDQGHCRKSGASVEARGKSCDVCDTCECFDWLGLKWDKLAGVSTGCCPNLPEKNVTFEADIRKTD